MFFSYECMFEVVCINLVEIKTPKVKNIESALDTASALTNHI